jgi:hypothetical protein
VKLLTLMCRKTFRQNGILELFDAGPFEGPKSGAAVFSVTPRPWVASPETLTFVRISDEPPGVTTAASESVAPLAVFRTFSERTKSRFTWC